MFSSTTTFCLMNKGSACLYNLNNFNVIYEEIDFKSCKKRKKKKRDSNKQSRYLYDLTKKIGKHNGLKRLHITYSLELYYCYIVY